MRAERIKLTWTHDPDNRQWIAKAPARDFMGNEGFYTIHAIEGALHNDRGRFRVVVFPVSIHSGVDEADMFPRYYFKFENLQDEMEAWVNARGECAAMKKEA